MQVPTKDKGGYLRLESRRWTFVTKQIEGTYPNWRNITDDVQEFSGSIEVSDQAAEAITRIVPRLPGDDTPNHTVGLYICSGKLFLRGFNKDQERPTEVEVPGVTVSGDPATVYVNRQYLLKAISFGLRTIGVQEALRPLRFSDGGSRQMIVMPVRVDANTGTSKVSVPVPITPKASDDALGQPTTINPNPQPPEERNQSHEGAGSDRCRRDAPALPQLGGGVVGKIKRTCCEAGSFLATSLVRPNSHSLLGCFLSFLPRASDDVIGSASMASP